LNMHNFRHYILLQEKAQSKIRYAFLIPIFIIILHLKVTDSSKRAQSFDALFL
jgi:hypothetical protein